jgi:hypothetical protein
MADRNKIAQALNETELAAFNEMLASLPGSERTYAAIQRRAQEQLGLTLSIESAKSYREKTFKNYLRRMERRRDFAERVTSARQESTGGTFADAAAENLAELVFDMTEEMSEAIEEGGALDLKKASTTAFIINKIRQGDVARGNLQIKLDDAERREKEREEKNRQAGEKLAKLRDPSAGLDEAERVAILDEVDRLMGLKR